MKHDALFIGADIGTSGAKIALFNEKGEIIEESHYSYNVYHPIPGWVEQDSNDWWKAFVNGVSKAVEKSGLKNKILGIGLTHQRLSFVPVDHNLQPLRPAILWNDTRCFNENKEAEDKCNGKWIFQRTGCYPGLWSVYKVLWMKNNERELYDKIDKIMLVFDFICHKLTGKMCTTESAAIMTGALDVKRKNKWALDVLECLGIRKNIWVETILPGGIEAGKIQNEIAKEIGLPEGVVIATTAGDQPCGSLGAGLLKQDEVAVNGGTSCTLEVLSKDLPNLSKPSFFMEISPTGEYILEESIYSGGSALMNWFRKNFFRYEEELIKTRSENIWEKLYSLAEESPPGSRGVMIIPYFSGASAPFWDLSARGSISGLALGTEKKDIVRAIIEGIAMEARRQLEFIEEATGRKIEKVIMYGGSARSNVWNQIFADVLQRKLVVPRTVETSALGAAICAAVASGYYESFKEAVENMTGISRIFEPNVIYKSLYNEIFEEVYKPFYGRISDLVSKLTKITSKMIKRR